MPTKRRLPQVKIQEGFWPHRNRKCFGSALYARVSTHDQQTLPLQIRAMREYAAKRGWTIAAQIKEVGSGASQRELRETLIAAARRREIDVVLVWRLDRWGRSVADLVSTLQELQHLGVGFVSLTEALDLTTPAGRAMAGLLAVFAEFEREILRERARAGLAHARQNGKRLGRPPTAALQAAEVRKLYRQASANPRSPAGCRSAEPPSAASWQRSHEKTAERPDPRRPHPQRSHRRCLRAGRAGDELVLLSGKQTDVSFHTPSCIRSQATSPLRKGETVEVRRLAKEEACASDMLVQIRWQGRKMAVPLSQLAAIDPDESTAEAIGDWHYWVAQGYLF